jgi:hypothetical protein
LALCAYSAHQKANQGAEFHRDRRNVDARRFKLSVRGLVSDAVEINDTRVRLPGSGLLVGEERHSIFERKPAEPPIFRIVDIPPSPTPPIRIGRSAPDCRPAGVIYGGLKLSEAQHEVGVIVDELLLLYPCDPLRIPLLLASSLCASRPASTLL